jgi:hypothetical protein
MPVDKYPVFGITMQRMTHEPILDLLRRNLRSVPPAEWERIAAEAGVAKTLPRKIVYGDRQNPGVNTIQPLVDWFNQREQLREAA